MLTRDRAANNINWLANKYVCNMCSSRVLILFSTYFKDGGLLLLGLLLSQKVIRILSEIDDITYRALLDRNRSRITLLRHFARNIDYETEKRCGDVLEIKKKPNIINNNKNIPTSKWSVKNVQ